MTENIHIKKIILHNFQKHSDLELEFTKDVNVIYGESDEGKSCVIRAIRWICFNEPKGDVIRKEGTKETSVKLTLSTDVTIERIRTASINAYVISKEGMEDKRFDSIGKDIPDEVKRVLQLSTFDVDKESLILNVAKQLTLPFLMDKSGTFRSKLFNKMTGNDITDKVSGSLNKDILQAKRAIKSEDEHLTEGKTKIEELEKEQVAINKTYEEYSTLYKSLTELEKEYEKLVDLSTQLNENDSIIKEEKEHLKNIKTIDDSVIENLKKLNRELEQLSIIYRDLKLADEEIADLKNMLKDCNIPDVDLIEDLHEYSDKLSKLETLSKDLRLLDEEISETKELLKSSTVPDINLKELKNMALELAKLESIFNELQELTKVIDKTSNDIKDCEEDIEGFNLKKEELCKKSNICTRCKGTGYEPSE